jgi:signal transduction histidine kinase
MCSCSIAISGPEDPTKLYVERALVQIRKLDNLIVDLLDLSKIESGKLKFNKKLFEFESTLSNAVEMIRQTYPGISHRQDGDADIQLYGDETRIEQVIINYLTNAVKYSPDNKEIHVEASVRPDGRLFVRCATSASASGRTINPISSVNSTGWKRPPTGSRGWASVVYLCGDHPAARRGIWCGE